jgi:dynein assembly factor 1
MKNTPLAKAYKNYRKRLVASLKKLTYLDDRPVKHIDHRLAEAWVKGGVQQEN